MWQTNLIKLYCAVSEHDNTMEAMTQRQSNNFRPEFSDEECITVYLRGICQRRFEQRTIYDYTKNHLLDWFPKLPSYAAFSRRLSFLVPAFQALAEEWLTVILKKEVENTTYIVDSCPVILAKGPRSGYAKVAGELCAKSYNSSRKEWYYGVKLHAFVARKPGRLPAPMGLFLSGACRFYNSFAGQRFKVNKQVHYASAAVLVAFSFQASRFCWDTPFLNQLPVGFVQTDYWAQRIIGLLVYIQDILHAVLQIPPPAWGCTIPSFAKA